MVNARSVLASIQTVKAEERYAHQLIGNFEDNAEHVYKGIMALLSGDVNYIFNE